ncbi:uncharacterized protein IL334_007364 [Kwoniella shivajii]|uniref:Integral membrane protein n=1 Tax=Kwoniella shivajii TaxID=564305 RepID=A0ABZ1D993_9TREE|nr:hypothetical protein IL334_007364 [Kwoniella shivajii]
MTRSSSKNELPSHQVQALVRIAGPFLAALTMVFLILPGVSGPQTGYFWLRVKYHSQGGSWDLGGLGVCKVGEKCQEGQNPPPHYTSIKQNLQLHLASTIIFFITSLFSFVLFRFPTADITKRWGTTIPLFAILFPLIDMIADLCVAHSLEIKTDVENVERIGVFWLGTIGLVLSVLWCITAQLDGMYRRREVAEFDRKIAESSEDPEKGWGDKLVETAYELWPWKEARNTTKPKSRRNEEVRNSKKGKSESSSRKKNETV